jgi:hypothetical protein
MLTVKQARQQMAALGLRPPTPATVVNWIKRHGLGRKLGGGWVLVEHRWTPFLQGVLDRARSSGRRDWSDL